MPAGRPKGARNRRTAQNVAKAEALGVDPLDVMLENMRFYHQQVPGMAAKVLGSENAEMAVEALKALLGVRKLAQECASDAAPYVHARLSAHALAPADKETKELIFRTVYEKRE